jgi:hypothetical protein
MINGQLAVEISSDVIVTATIAWRLGTARTGFAHTDKFLNRLLR